MINSASFVQAQEPWQPQRPATVNNNQPHSIDVGRTDNSDNFSRPVLSSSQRVGTSVTLRWQKTAPRGVNHGLQPTQRDSAPEADQSEFVGTTTQPASLSTVSSANFVRTHPPVVDNASVIVSAPSQENPLRSTTSRPVGINAVQPAAYQSESAEMRSGQHSISNSSPRWIAVDSSSGLQDPFGDEPLPNRSLPDASRVPAELLDKPNPINGNSLEDLSSGLLDQNNSPSLPSMDLLDQSETAPSPPAIQEPSDKSPSFPKQVPDQRSPQAEPRRNSLNGPARTPNSSSDSDNQDQDESKKDVDELDDLIKRARKAATPNCTSQRDLQRGKPLSSISLDVTPKLSDGLRSLKGEDDDGEKSRQDFEKRSILRDWTDFKGDHIVQGRMIDLRLGNVILDVDGAQRRIQLSELSDIDMNYIADLWNLPNRCGYGFEPRVGRDYVASTVQWKASGACHNPLYFEQVQLERYGHDAGPFVQPLLSSAHFFTSIPLLPYKMGINPPNECQYALGYYRPGNCAPYMIQPFPWSLRGAVVQAGAVAGVATIFP